MAASDQDKQDTRAAPTLDDASKQMDTVLGEIGALLDTCAAVFARSPAKPTELLNLMAMLANARQQITSAQNQAKNVRL